MVSTVKYIIKTMLKNGILDNAGKATTQALHNLGFSEVNNVRKGKVDFVFWANLPNESNVLFYFDKH